MSETTALVTESEVPIWPLFVTHVLGALSAGETLHRRDIVSRAIDSASLSEAARAETLNMGDFAPSRGWVGPSVIYLKPDGLNGRSTSTTASRRPGGSG